MDLTLFLALVALFLVGLVLIPFGLPGLWLMVIALVGYAVLDGFTRIGWGTLALVVVLAGLAEAAEAWLSFRFARRYGGSSRAGWGALLGGLIGAVIGTPVPIIGSVIGAFLGAFAGAVGLELLGGAERRASFSAGWGAVLGKAAGAATKIFVGLCIAIIGVFSVIS
ncbi:MAG: DUF456 domain-containing protein [Gemmatimonadetes bacterium]|uniref:DUF456 domain-containing protein n=1 Tax=Candidatus Kutchimonas denitrificans TaxID=3056748 RepID=A0AAE5CCU2_9BACT|nr:DUF456 domain-containing protein [Gemmatimonadota bacterium]NIR76140.1 DUF456 domain-containing protein [Candidatus Kutchimonas denitrificans]NIS00519.1 DUF456 domain-containing protein [Gemmatimonadota bacterium]NIT66177.1 DUF456 domain-containing protein [Gemmatimonadota bacterium]NIU54255.1 DUF456 family protein [Gemmatimonadota bacterium]